MTLLNVTEKQYRESECEPPRLIEPNKTQLINKLTEGKMINKMYFYRLFCRRCTYQGINCFAALSSGHFTKRNNCDSLCYAIQIVVTVGGI